MNRWLRRSKTATPENEVEGIATAVTMPQGSRYMPKETARR
jgi:hypothetical protein